MKLLPFLPTTTSTSNSSDNNLHHHHHQKPPASPSPSPSPSSWQWTACGHLETLSFRAPTSDFDTSSVKPEEPSSVSTRTSEIDMITGTLVSCFTNSSEEPSRSLLTRPEESEFDPVETVIRGLKSDRLFFEPGESNSILEDAKKSTTSKGGGNQGGGGECGFDLVPYKESVFLSMESKDPFIDFRSSMEEMIMAHGLKDWECLEELLGWYLKVNGKGNHGYIIGAFVDLLASLFSSSCSFVSSSVPDSASTDATADAAAAASSSSSSSSFSCACSPSSPLSLPSSSLTTPCLSSLDQVDEDDDENGEESSNLHHS